MEHIKENDAKIYAVSADDNTALVSRCVWLAKRLEAGENPRLLFGGDRADRGPYRRAFAVSEIEEAVEALNTFPPKMRKKLKLVFAMPGQGSAGPIPVESLCAELPVFREYIERAQRVLGRQGRLSAKEILSRGRARSSMDEQLFVLIYGTALAMQYRAWGAEPDMVIAHSLGELTALVVCGMASYEEMLCFVCRRALIIDSLAESGAMAHVAADAAEIFRMTTAYGGKLSVAAVNSRSSVVVSGELRALSSFERELDRRTIPHRRLRVPKAAHSAIMEPALAPIEALAFPTLRDGCCPLFSSVTGAQLTAREAEAPVWRRRHCRGTVRFDLALAALSETLGDSDSFFIEFGVHRVLTAAGIKTLPDSRWYGASSMARYHENRSPEYCFKRGILETLAALWECNILSEIQPALPVCYQ
ncbi:acyltransferase domain-containing protein [Cloacibacillus sp.]